MTTVDNDKTISLDFELTHPPEKVWRALTDPTLLSRWLMANDMDARLGAQFTFRLDPKLINSTPGGWDGIVNCEVLALEACKRLQYTWNGGGVVTVVTWSLTPIPTGTRLSLEQSGTFPDHIPAFQGARRGWQHMVGQRLKELLNDA